MSYVYLQTGELIKENDEFYRPVFDDWAITAEGKLGHFVPNNMNYRRPVKEMTINDDGSICQ